MRSRPTFFFFLFVVLPAALGLSACFGNEGDICQVTGDCHTGLSCCRPYGTGGVPSWQQRGTCETSCTGVVDGGPHDSGAGTDSGLHDLGTDTGIDAGGDAGGDADVDAGGDAGGDAGTVDAGGDAGAVSDAGDVDAGDTDADVDLGP